MLANINVADKNSFIVMLVLNIPTAKVVSKFLRRSSAHRYLPTKYPRQSKIPLQETTAPQDLGMYGNEEKILGFSCFLVLGRPSLLRMIH